MTARTDELERLQRLRESGVLTEEEFQAEKRRLLSGPAPLPSGAQLPPFDTREAPEGEVDAEAEARRNRNVLLALLALLGLGLAIGLGVWLGMTDTTIGRRGVFIGFENYRWLFDDPVFWLSVYNTFVYTVVASILKFMLGLWLALLLNRSIRHTTFLRAIVLLPWISPPGESASRTSPSMR